MSQHQPCATRSVRLSLLEGLLLDEISQRTATPVDPPWPAAIETAREKLADANAIARWLREDVVLDLQPSEIRAFLPALEVALQRADATPHDWARLARLHDCLTEALASPVGVVGAVAGLHQTACVTAPGLTS